MGDLVSASRANGGATWWVILEALSRAGGGATWWVIWEVFSRADGGASWWVIQEAFSRADGSATWWVIWEVLSRVNGGATWWVTWEASSRAECTWCVCAGFSELIIVDDMNESGAISIRISFSGPFAGILAGLRQRSCL